MPVNTLGLRKLAVLAEQHTVDKSGLKYWGTLDLEAMGEGMRFSIGIRTSHDRTTSLALIAGYRVMVCQNGCFSGDFLPVMRKHNENMNLIEAVTSRRAPCPKSAPPSGLLASIFAPG